MRRILEKARSNPVCYCNTTYLCTNTPLDDSKRRSKKKPQQLKQDSLLLVMVVAPVGVDGSVICVYVCKCFCVVCERGMIA